MAASKLCPISEKAPVREAAAKTVRVRGLGVAVGELAVAGTETRSSAIDAGVEEDPQATMKPVRRKIGNVILFKRFSSFPIS